MPIYEYACQKCGKVVEVFQKASEKGPKACEKCGGKLARVISHTSFQLKGGGWYKDLYASAKPGSDSDGASEGPAATTDTPKAEGAKTEAAKAEPTKVEAKPAVKPEAKPAAKPAPKPAAKPAAKSAKRR